MIASLNLSAQAVRTPTTFRSTRATCPSRRPATCHAALKIHYFDFPGRAEPARLILGHAKVPFEDVRIDREAWPTFKPQTPFGQCPVLEVEGQLLAQTAAIDRYAGAVAGLLPSDPLKVLQAEQWYFLPNDINQLFIGTFKAEDKVAARKPIVEGPFKEKLRLLEKHMEGKKYILGEELCYVDFSLYAALSLWGSGFLEGIPTDYIKEFPNLKAYRNRIASLESVQAAHADKTAPSYNAYKPDA